MYGQRSLHSIWHVACLCLHNLLDLGLRGQWAKLLKRWERANVVRVQQSCFVNCTMLSATLWQHMHDIIRLAA